MQGKTNEYQYEDKYGCVRTDKNLIHLEKSPRTLSG